MNFSECGILYVMQPVSRHSPERFILDPVTVQGFEGPLDLLLFLIEEGQLDITGISLAAVTEQYLERIKHAGDIPAEHLADFILVAATLLLLKSKRLFPDLVLTEEEEERILNLEEQLQQYRKFRAVAKEFLRLWERRNFLHSRERFLGLAPMFAPPVGLDRIGLRSALTSVLDHLPHLEILTEEVVRQVVSIEECIRDIQALIARRVALTFGEVAQNAGSRLEVIVSFLALLELVKQRMIAARQAQPFRDILVSRHPSASSQTVHGPHE